MISQIKSAAHNGYGSAILYTAIITAAVTDTIPTIADALVFREQFNIKQELEAGKITPKQYWLRDAAAYYLYNPIWWVIFGVAVAAFPGDTKNKAKLAIGLLSAGAVVGVLWKNIEQDRQTQILQQKTVKS